MTPQKKKPRDIAVHGVGVTSAVKIIDDLPKRIKSKIQVDQKAGCWEWLAHKNHDGYGRVSYLGKFIVAHRVVYTLLKGPIPEGLQLDHLCRNRACCNPEHLEPVTHAENVRRGNQGLYLKQRTHCLAGHELSEANIYIRKGGHGRLCRECKRAGERRRGREYRKIKTQAALRNMRLG